MLLIFRCEQCGKRFRVKDRYRGRRGRCKYCGHVMIIPWTLTEVTVRKRNVDAPHSATPAAPPVDEPLFRLSPPELSPRIYTTRPPLEIETVQERQPAENRHAELAASPPLPPQQSDEPVYEIELVDDDEDIRAAPPVSPEIERGLREMAEFAKNPRGYSLDTSSSGRGYFSLGRRGDSGPASWLVVTWRAAITRILKLLRFIDAWAYLISVPFLVLLAVGFIIAHRPLANFSAVMVFLVNYGRFWTDLLALFVRPFRQSPMHGLAFLCPPYGLYYIVTRWRQVKPTLRRMATSCIPIVLVVLAYAFSPLVNPGVENVEGMSAKLEAGEKQLVKDIHAGVQQIRGRLPSLETKPEAEPEPKP